MQKLQNRVAAKLSLRRRQLIAGGRVVGRGGSPSLTAMSARLDVAGARLQAARRAVRAR